MTQLQINYEKWIENHINNGSNLTSFDCPSCNKEIKTLVPDFNDYDTMSVCPFCGELFFKIVNTKGEVTIK